MNFVNKGSDLNLVKALNRQGLIQKEVQVKGKHGVYTRNQWVAPEKVTAPQYSKTPEKKKSTKPRTLYFPKADCGNPRTRVFTYSEVMTYYNQNKATIRMPFQKFVSTNYFVSDGSSHTSHVYKTAKGYTKERKKLHDKLIKEIVDSANSPTDGEPPVAILMGGGSASGKGTIRKSKVIPAFQEKGIQLGISDCDDIKEKLPEYSPFKGQDGTTAALRVHTESMDISMAAIDELIKNGKNLMFDSTMKNTAKMSGIVKKLKEAGYEVRIVGADVPLEIAMERSELRNQETGRKVPEHVIKDSHGGFSTVYPELITQVDAYSLYDNSEYPPVLVQDERGVHRPDLYERFLQKGKTHSAEKQLRKLSELYGVPQKELKELYTNGVDLTEIEDYLESGLYEGV